MIELGRSRGDRGMTELLVWSRGDRGMTELVWSRGDKGVIELGSGLGVTEG